MPIEKYWYFFLQEVALGDMEAWQLVQLQQGRKMIVSIFWYNLQETSCHGRYRKALIKKTEKRRRDEILHLNCSYLFKKTNLAQPQ